ncbi:MAG: hypothetical protein AAGF56_03650, partial [Pseudomonadota bacterium]
MLNAYSLGFVGVAIAAVAGVDYYDQSNKADFGLGQMPITSYVQTIPNRFSAAQLEKSAEDEERERKRRWRQGGLPYLPEAPEGWTRRALLEGDDSAIMPPEDTVGGDSAGQSLLEQMEARDAVKQAKERATRSWIYQRGTETVFVEIKTVERPDSNSLIGLVSTVMEQHMMGSFERDQGYGVVGGVGLTEKLGSNNDRPYHFRVLEGSIGFGHEVHIKVHANASKQATYEILEKIDFDGLNSLLPNPMETVGNGVEVPERLDEVELSMALRDLRSDFLNLRGIEAQYRIANLDTNALLVNTYATALTGADAATDITGGKQINLSSLVELGYRTGRHALMQGKSAEEVKVDVKKMIDTAVMIVDAETAAAAARAANAPEPEMSPELKAELASLSQGQMSQPGDINATRHAKSSGRSDPMMQIDKEATAAAGGLVRSHQGDTLHFKNLAMSMDVSESEAEFTFQQDARQFADKYGLPYNSCKFVAANVRFECDHVQGSSDTAKQAAKNRARDLKKDPETKIVMDLDAQATEAAQGKTLSKTIDYLPFEMFKEKRSATDAEMSASMELLAREFEAKHDLPADSCTFRMSYLRLECDAVQGAQSSNASKTLVSKPLPQE